MKFRALGLGRNIVGLFSKKEANLSKAFTPEAEREVKKDLRPDRYYFFMTKNSTYTVNSTAKTIRGGVFGKYWTPYESIKLFQGTHALIELISGQTVVTSTVRKIQG